MSSYDGVSIIDREGLWTKEREFFTMSHCEENENKKIRRQVVTREF